MTYNLKEVGLGNTQFEILLCVSSVYGLGFFGFGFRNVYNINLSPFFPLSLSNTQFFPDLGKAPSLDHTIQGVWCLKQQKNDLQGKI